MNAVVRGSVVLIWCFATLSESRILWRVEPLLCNDREISKYTGVVPAVTVTHAIEVLLEMVFSTRSVQRGWNEDS
jgi:hypothetical protein